MDTQVRLLALVMAGGRVAATFDAPPGAKPGEQEVVAAMGGAPAEALDPRCPEPV